MCTVCPQLVLFALQAFRVWIPLAFLRSVRVEAQALSCHLSVHHANLVVMRVWKVPRNALFARQGTLVRMQLQVNYEMCTRCVTFVSSR